MYEIFFCLFFQMQLDEQTRLIAERGMVLIGNEDEDDNDFEKITEEDQDKRTRGIVSSDTAAILSGNKQTVDTYIWHFFYIYVSAYNFPFYLYFLGLGSGPLDVRIKKLAEERDDLQDTVRRLKMDLDEEKSRSQRLERSPFNPEEAEWETKKVLDDYKFKLQKSEQDINTLQTNVRLLWNYYQNF